MTRNMKIVGGSAIMLLLCGFLVGSRTVTDKSTDMWLDCGSALIKVFGSPSAQQCAPQFYEPQRTIALVLLVLGAALIVVAVGSAAAGRHVRA